MVWLAQSTAEALTEPADGLEDTGLGPAGSAVEKYGGLSKRELEVAGLIAQGKSNREIAEAMTVGVRTAETYIRQILNKLNMSSRVQIATWAVEKGLGATGN